MMWFAKSALLGFATLALPLAVRGDGAGDAAQALFGGRQTIATSAYHLGVTPSEILTIRFLERPLKIPLVGDWLQSKTAGTATHVQIVAYDSKGKIVDNFGLTSSKTSMKPQPAAIEVEKPKTIERQYNPTPLGEITMTAADYIRARDDTKQQVQYYSPLNNVDLDGSMRAGAAFGSAIGSFVGEKTVPALPGIPPEVVGKIAGMLVGWGAGGLGAVSTYQSTGGKEPGVVDDSSAKMCFTAENCHYLPIRFLMNGEGRYQVVKPYTIPGPREDDGKEKESPVVATGDEVALPSDAVEDLHADESAGMSADGIGSNTFSGDHDSKDVEPQVPPQPVPDAVGNTPEDVAVAWLRAYNAGDMVRMKELSTPEFVEMWEVGRDDFPKPPENWRDATIETTQTGTKEITPTDPDWEPIEIGVECTCTGSDSTSYQGGLFIYRYKSSGLYKVGFALLVPPE